jgi:DNA-binding MarR family transcriptional regulator
MNPAPPVCINYNLRKASLIVSKIYRQEMRTAPVRGPQYSLMMMIARRDNPTISALARDIGADRTTMTRNLEQLQKKGFIYVTRGKDLRTKAIQVAPKGHAALERSKSCWQKAQAKVLKALGEDRWSRMMSDLAVLTMLARHE